MADTGAPLEARVPLEARAPLITPTQSIKERDGTAHIVGAMVATKRTPPMPSLTNPLLII